MKNLKKLQQELLAGVLRNDKNYLSGIKPFGSIKAQDKFQIHVDTIMVNFVNSLKISFPGTWQLLGNDCATGAALAYSHDKNNLTDRLNINLFGERFPLFLSQFESTKNILYIKDFAKMEWLRSLCYGAKKSAIITPSELQSIKPGKLEGTRLYFNDSLKLMQSSFSLDQIQDILDNPNSGSVNLRNKISYILICRVNNKVCTHFLDKFMWSFIYLLNEGKSLGEVIESQDFKENIPDLANAFAFMMDKQLITNISN